ncbi:unnamed protein product, partial [Closterium sp. Naga37s-1]
VCALILACLVAYIIFWVCALLACLFAYDNFWVFFSRPAHSHPNPTHPHLSPSGVCALLLACLFAYDIFWVFFYLPRSCIIFTHLHPITPIPSQVCALLLACLFSYDIFWVFFSHLHTHICIPYPPPLTPLTPQVCALLLACLFAYDIFWVFFSHRFFGTNVMLSVATQHAHNPAHSVAHSLHLPSAVAKSIVREIELPVKLLFPRDLFGELNIFKGGGRARDFMVLGLGDMVIATQHAHNPAHSVAHSLHLPSAVAKSIVREIELPVKLLFPRDLPYQHAAGSCAVRGAAQETAHSQQQQHSQDILSRPLLDSSPSAREREKGQLGYMWVAAVGYAVGLVAALAAGVLTRSPQPALLYLVPSTLGPVSLVAWRRGELADLWDGSPGLMPFDRDKLETLDV